MNNSKSSGAWCSTGAAKHDGALCWIQFNGSKTAPVTYLSCSTACQSATDVLYQSQTRQSRSSIMSF